DGGEGAPVAIVERGGEAREVRANLGEDARGAEEEDARVPQVAGGDVARGRGRIGFLDEAGDAQRAVRAGAVGLEGAEAGVGAGRGRPRGRGAGRRGPRRRGTRPRRRYSGRRGTRR